MSFKCACCGKQQPRKTKSHVRVLATRVKHYINEQGKETKGFEPARTQQPVCNTCITPTTR